MTNRTFNPPLAATILSLTLLAVLVSLGVWQLHRLEWKTALLSDIRTRMEKTAVPLPENIDNPDAWEYRRVTMAGQFLNDNEFLLRPRTLDGVNGYHMLVPFRRLSGGIVFVNRGWVSDELMPKAVRPGGLQQIEGIVQLPHKTYFTPPNAPPKGEWYWADLPAMASAANLASPAPVIVSISTRKPGVYPAGGTVTVNIRNDHKQYAIFWFTMALVSQVIFILRFRQKKA